MISRKNFKHKYVGFYSSFYPFSRATGVVVENVSSWHEARLIGNESGATDWLNIQEKCEITQCEGLTVAHSANDISLKHGEEGHAASIYHYFFENNIFCCGPVCPPGRGKGPTGDRLMIVGSCIECAAAGGESGEYSWGVGGGWLLSLRGKPRLYVWVQGGWWWV